MGSPLRLSVAGLAAPAARRAWAVAIGDVERTEAALSRFRAESDLSLVNATAGSGIWVSASPRLYAMLAASERARHLTGGRFDARIIQVLERLGERAGATLPDTTPRASARPWLERDPRRRRVRLWAAADSGGIGKGLALRWAAGAVARAGLSGRGLLLEAGGDIIARGSAPDGGPWRIGVEDPALPDGEPLAVLGAADRSIVTSSVAIRRWQTDDGVSVHHLIDPFTGESGGEGLTAVTVLGPDPAWAEVWSKALFLSGAGGIGGEARRRGLAAWWVESDGSLHLTPAARRDTLWERATAT